MKPSKTCDWPETREAEKVMAYRRATGLAQRRGTVSYLSYILQFRRVSPVVVNELASSEAPPQQQQHSGKSRQRVFSFHSARYASSFLTERSPGYSFFSGSGLGTGKYLRMLIALIGRLSSPVPLSSQVLGKKSDVRMPSEDQEEETDPRMWADEGYDFTDQPGDKIIEAAAAVERDVMDSGVGEISSGSIWSILRAPADGVVVLVDGLHTLTGTSWWITIIGSTLAFRAVLFPFTMTYIKKSALFATSMSLLPPIRPPKDSNKSFSEQYSIFTKRRLELGVPSPLWATAGFLQAPLVLYWIIALRGMAMSHHPGFESGGVLWFVDLTLPVHGALGALFPGLVALTYFLNIQVSFRVIKPRNDLAGFFMKIYQWWLEAATIPLFIMGFYLPQGVFMYWLTNNCFNLAQSVALQHDGFRGKFGIPLLSELAKLKADQASRSTDTDNSDPRKLDVDALLSSATRHVTQDREEEAVKLLKFLLNNHPEEPETYNVYGMLYIKKQRWAEAIEYYNLAISKAKDDSPRITAFMGIGISLYNLGRRQEAIDFMKPLVDIKVPQEPVTLQKYLRALVTLGSALSQEGLKEEALSVLELAVKWDRSVQVYIKELRQELDNS